LRFDVTTSDWVVFASNRSERPSQTTLPSSPRATADVEETCPFCPGNEAECGAAIDVEMDPEHAERWLVRAFPNKYPALLPGAPLVRDGSGPFFREMVGRGVHEVVVCSPHHARPIAQLPVQQVTALLRLLHRRHRVLAADPQLEIVQVFENRGRRAGASLFHPHLQIVAAPVVPRHVRLKYSMAADYYNAQGVSLYADHCRAELAAGRRVVIETPDFVAFVPFASRVPYETWIVPRKGAPSFELSDPSSLPSLAATLRELLGRLHVALDDPAYNLTFFGAPRRHVDEPDFVWHIEVLPRLGIAAGFELATGMAINSVLPETAAQVLRDVPMSALSEP
jgi:UDPglucose--hexose-1-phosphate uridylyltransferase